MHYVSLNKLSFSLVLVNKILNVIRIQMRSWEIYFHHLLHWNTSREITITLNNSYT